LDAALIANKCIDSYIKSKQLGILYKFNIGKAYDHVPWDFRLATVEKMGFRCKWKNWASFCISVCFSILTNREGSGYFSSSKGLRRDDHLLPLLFTLVVEAPSKRERSS